MWLSVIKSSKNWKCELRKLVLRIVCVNQNNPVLKFTIRVCEKLKKMLCLAWNAHAWKCFFFRHDLHAQKKSTFVIKIRMNNVNHWDSKYDCVPLIDILYVYQYNYIFLIIIKVNHFTFWLTELIYTYT